MPSPEPAGPTDTDTDTRTDTEAAMDATAEPPLADAEQADTTLAEQLVRLTRRMQRAQKRHLEPLAITPAQSRLLRILAHAEAPPRMADLAARLEVVPRAVTTLVDALETAGAVRRVPDPANRRVIRIELTAAGRSTLGALRGARRAAAEDVLAPLSPAQREILGGLLSTLIDEPSRRC